MPDYGPILFVDDEAAMRQSVTQCLGLSGFETLVHDKASTAAQSLDREFAGILVTDLKMEGMDGLALLRRSQEIDPELPVVVITGHGDVETAVEAMRLGAYDFIVKPFAPERFLDVVRREFIGREPERVVMEDRLPARLRQIHRLRHFRQPAPQLNASHKIIIRQHRSRHTRPWAKHKR